MKYRINYKEFELWINSLIKFKDNKCDVECYFFDESGLVAKISDKSVNQCKLFDLFTKNKERCNTCKQLIYEREKKLTK